MNTLFKGAFIAVLKQAQVLDKEIYDLNALVENIPREIKALDDEFNKQKAILDHFGQELRAIQLRQKELDNDLKAREGNVSKLDAQLAQVKTNKEYAALQQEIKSLKADISLVEEKIILIYDEIDTHQAKVNIEKERLKKEDAEINKKKKELEDKKVVASQRAKDLRSQRVEVLKQVDREVVAQYENIVRHKQGLALSPLQDENCGVCQMTIRPQIQNEVKLGDRMVFCESCGRILYAE